MRRLLNGSGAGQPRFLAKMLAAPLAENLGVRITGNLAFANGKIFYGDFREVLASWMGPSGVAVTDADLRALERLPIPSFGSPPSAWAAIGAKVAAGGATAILDGFAIELGHPLLIVLEVGAVTVAWFIKPTAKVARRAPAERVAMSLGTTMKDSDE